MKLSDFFSINPRKTTGSQKQTASADPARTALLNRQIRALTPGQTISGEIVARNGSEVQIRLSEDMVLNARVEQNINLELGRSMTFEVKNNGASLTLSPLFANTATDANLLKALDMAALPVNRITVDMTQAMMKGGLSIDKNSLQQMYRELNTHPEAKLEDIVDLHRLGLPVTRENLEQIASYKNLTYQLVTGMNDVLDALTSAVGELIEIGRPDAAARLFSDILQLVDGELSGAFPAGGETALTGQAGETVQAGNTVQDGDSVQAGQAGAAGPSGQVSGGLEGTGDDGLTGMMESIPNKPEENSNFLSVTRNPAEGDGTASPLNQEDGIRLAGRLSLMLDHLNLPEEEQLQLSQQIQNLARGAADTGEILRLTGSLLYQASLAKNTSDIRAGVAALLADTGLKELLSRTLRDSWTIRPQEMGDSGKLGELYNRLNRQLHGLSEALNSAGASGSNASGNVNQMIQNLDFLQQLNQMYTYVQLPLKMSQNSAHGDLYVYSNKKHLASKDGNISALLHLDMQNLGPVDVFVALQGERVNTRFYVADDEMIDFLADHMDILNRRLEERGYKMKCEMQVREAERSGNPVLENMLSENTPGTPVVQYAFDVRA